MSILWALSTTCQSGVEYTMQFWTGCLETLKKNCTPDTSKMKEFFRCAKCNLLSHGGVYMSLIKTGFETTFVHSFK